MIETRSKEERSQFLIEEQERRKSEVSERLERLRMEKELKKKEMAEHAKRVLSTYRREGGPKYRQIEKRF